MTPVKVALTIYQGATFRYPFFWYSDVEVSKAITGITRSYPTIITAVGHGLPTSKIPVAILGVADWLDTPSADSSDRIYGTKTGTDTLSVPVDGIGEAAYSGSAGRLVYNTPMDLATGWTARMYVRESIDTATTLVEFTDAAGQISLGSDGEIELTLTETETDTLDFSAAVFDLELKETATGDVWRVAEGKVTLKKQVTHD